MSGDGLVPPLNAPRAGAITPGVQPGISQAVITANRVIVFGANGGIFVYSGKPAANNLIYSVAGSGGTDPYGNVYLEGAVGYGLIAGNFVATQILDGVITLYDGVTLGSEAGGWTAGGGFGGSQGIVGMNTSVTLPVPIQVTAASNSFIVGAASVTGGNSAVDFVPGKGWTAQVSGVDETWHTLSLTTITASGNGVNGFRYKLMPFNCLLLEWDINTNSVGNGVTVATLPAGWRPATAHNIASGTYAGAVSLTTAVNPHWTVNTNGTIVTGATGGNAFSMCGTAIIAMD